MLAAVRRVGLLLALSLACLGPSPAALRLEAPVPDAARPLPLTAVRLTGGPLKQAQDLTATYLLSLEPDRMLSYYRQRAGLQPKAPPYGGWDGDGRNLTGHIAGHYLSAVSLMWAATGDERFKQRAAYIVSELALVQQAHGNGYLGALAGAREAFAAVSRGQIRSASFDLNGLWSPWYTLHKTFAGLRDAYRHTGNRAALDLAVAFAGWVERVLQPLDEAQLQRMLNTEFGGMNEVLADLYADSSDRRWLDLSRRFEHHAVLAPLKRGEDPLDGLHGNTQVPKLIGSAARHGYVGEPSDLAAARHFWTRVVRHHTFATGGHGKDEYFREPDRLGAIVDGRTAETCNIYNMLKLTRRLFALRPGAELAEFHERALFNHILGSIAPEDGAVCYMVPVGRGARREYQRMRDDFTCCVGTGMESHALHGDGLYYEAGERLWVNVYAPSTARSDSTGVALTVETDFPEGDAVVVRITASGPRPMTLALRRPVWAVEGFSVRVNGETVAGVPAPGSYVELTRRWRTGDTVELTLVKALRLEAVPDNPRRVAVLWGPLVLAGDLGPEPEGDGQPEPQVESTTVLAAGRPVGEWVKPAAGARGEFVLAAANGRSVRLLPFYRLHRRIYAAYWDLATEVEYQAARTAREGERERQRRLDAATVAFVPAGETEREKVFNPRGEGSSSIEADGRRGRRATKWLSYDIPLRAAEPVALVLTYNSDTRRPRQFEVLVNGQRVGVEEMPKSSISRFFDVEYAVPADLVRGTEKVTVRLQALGDTEVAPVFGVRVIRAATGR